MSKDDDILNEAKEAFELAVEHEHDNRVEALDDVRFARLAEQWPDNVRRSREKDGRPCLTINRLPAFIRQVVNDARQNKPAIKVHPADSQADPATAQIYNGLIRNIEITSRADIAYDTALEHAASCGFGYFRIGTRYACDDTFELDLVIDRIANPFSVYGDPYSTASDSVDWNSAFVVDRLPKEEFAARYKGAKAVDWAEAGYEGLNTPWREDDDILIAEWWRREKVKKTVLLLSDQQVMADDIYAQHRKALDAIGVSVIGSREVMSHKVTQRLLTGAEVLETNDWAGRYIPLVPVYGEEVNVEGKRYLRSLIRDAKDPQRMFNYWRTTTTELVALAPKTPFIGPKGAFQTDQAKWETANTETHSYIEYDGNMPPQRQAFAGVPAGALQEALNASDDMKAIIGMYDASLGARSNETSGRAILARQREGDVSTFHFIDNLSRAIEHAGRILIDLIPKVYTGERIVRVLGQDGAGVSVQLGKPVVDAGPDGQPATNPATGQPLSRIYDLSVGKYDLTVSTGPSFTTRREEAASQMMELLRAFPSAAPMIADLVAKNLDWPGADEIAARFQALQGASRGSGAGPVNGSSQGTNQADAVRAQAEMQKAQNAALIEAQKLKLDAYKAETERMKVMHDLNAQRLRALSAGSRPIFAPETTSATASGGGGGETDTGCAEGEPCESDASYSRGNPTDVFSLGGGVVTRVGWQNPNDPRAGLGWRVYVTDNRGYQTGYGHMDPNTTPAVGTAIEPGDYLGRYANPTNGNSTNPHVHVQMFDPRGRIVDPGTESPLVKGQPTSRYNKRDSAHPQPHTGIDWIGVP